MRRYGIKQDFRATRIFQNKKLAAVLGYILSCEGMTPSDCWSYVDEEETVRTGKELGKQT